MQLFGEKGIAQVTIKDIAKMAGCAEGALYRYYESKEEMAWALFRGETARFGERVRERLMEDGSFPERIRRGVSAFYRFFDEDEVIFSFILLAQHDFPGREPIPPESNPNDLVARFVEQGNKAGAFHIEDPLLGAAMVLGLVLQPATMSLYGRLPGPLSDRIEPVSRACEKVLGCI
jgi:AcrR family transcriptional regulator